MNRSDFSFLEAMFKQPLDSIEAHVLIVNQSLDSELISIHDNIRVIPMRELGLSKSRNLVIENSIKDLCWILDDDCIIETDAISRVVAAHNEYLDAVLTFKTITPSGKGFYNYKKSFYKHDLKTIIPVLSPEITFKRKEIVQSNLRFDERFGLGAQFQDSENLVFLEEVLDKNLEIGFVPETIVQHDAVTSSNEVLSDRLIYARGALAGRRNAITAVFYSFKYVFFLWRKGYERSMSVLWHKMMVFQQGANDYVSGFKRPRENDVKQ